MKRIFATLGHALRTHVLVVGLVSLISFTGLLAIAAQPGYAATSSQKPAQEAVIGPDSQTYATREEAYDKAIKAANDPEGLEKEYQTDLKIYKEENPGKGGLVEGAKEAIDKLTEKPQLEND